MLVDWGWAPPGSGLSSFYGLRHGVLSLLKSKGNLRRQYKLWFFWNSLCTGKLSITLKICKRRMIHKCVVFCHSLGEMPWVPQYCCVRQGHLQETFCSTSCSQTTAVVLKDTKNFFPSSNWPKYKREWDLQIAKLSSARVCGCCH